MYLFHMQTLKVDKHSDDKIQIIDHRTLTFSVLVLALLLSQTLRTIQQTNGIKG